MLLTIVIEPKLKEEILRQEGVLHLLVKYAEDGIVEVHKPVDKETLNYNEIIGTGGGGVVFKTIMDDTVFSLKVLVLNDRSPKEVQHTLFRREIAFTRYNPSNCNSME
jgi:hypothetical protein